MKIFAVTFIHPSRKKLSITKEVGGFFSKTLEQQNAFFSKVALVADILENVPDETLIYSFLNDPEIQFGTKNQLSQFSSQKLGYFSSIPLFFTVEATLNDKGKWKVTHLHSVTFKPYDSDKECYRALNKKLDQAFPITSHNYLGDITKELTHPHQARHGLITFFLGSQHQQGAIPALPKDIANLICQYAAQPSHSDNESSSPGLN
jgi:hypothetical protein